MLSRPIREGLQVLKNNHRIKLSLEPAPTMLKCIHNTMNMSQNFRKECHTNPNNKTICTDNNPLWGYSEPYHPYSTLPSQSEEEASEPR
ncbi:hypothetical protein LguiA_000656 [Lonicera macranthoides]